MTLSTCRFGLLAHAMLFVGLFFSLHTARAQRPQSSGIELEIAERGACIDLGAVSASADFVIHLRNIGTADGAVNIAFHKNTDNVSLTVLRGSWRPGQILRRKAEQDSMVLRLQLYASTSYDSAKIVFRDSARTPIDSVCLRWHSTMYSLCDAVTQFHCIPPGTCDSAIVVSQNCGDSVIVRSFTIDGTKAAAFHFTWVHPAAPVFPLMVPSGDSLVTWFVFCPTDTGDYQDANVIADYGKFPDFLTNATGACAVASAVQDDARVPHVFELGQGAPNPASMEIAFPFVSTTSVSLAVIDALGRTCATASALPAPHGNARIRVDVSALPAGVYMCRMVSDHRVASRTRVVWR